VSNWYCLNSGPDPNDGEHNFGLYDVNETPKPAFYAMQALTTALKGKTFKEDNLTSGNTWALTYEAGVGGRQTLATWTVGDAGVSTIPGWGTHYLNGTPLYLGELQNYGGGAWSSSNWSNGGTWVSGSQAKFTSDATVSVNTVAEISSLQFGDSQITLNNGGGELRFGSGGGTIDISNYFYEIFPRNAIINAPITGGGDPSTCQIRKSGTGAITLAASNTVYGEPRPHQRGAGLDGQPSRLHQHLEVCDGHQHIQPGRTRRRRKPLHDKHGRRRH
jgi:hypothetical protein